MEIRFDPRDWFKGGAEPVPRSPGSDRALYAILASNGLTLAIAWWQQWGLLHLLWPFWIQSLVIGWFARRRILALGEYCTEGFIVNGKAVEATPATQRWTANFFVMHFGGFHLVYLAFLLIFSITVDAAGYMPVTHTDTGKVSLVHMGRVDAHDMLQFVLLGVAFWFSHRLSHREHLAADLARRPNIGSLMMLPYARVLPMHLCILLPAFLSQGAALWLFGLLKTAADLVMHRVEHAWLARRWRPRPHSS